MDAKAPDAVAETDADADTGTGFLGPLADCVAVLEDEASGGDDAKERADEFEDPGEDIDPPAPTPAEPTSEPSAAPSSVPDPGPAGPEAGSETEPTPEPGQREEDSAAPVVAPSPSPEPRPTENGTVSRASETTRPTPSVDHDQGVGERPPSKKVEEPQETGSVDGLAFEEASATSAFGRAVGVTSTTLLFLLAAGTLGLRLAVGWPRFPPLYLGRRRLSDDLDIH